MITRLDRQSFIKDVIQEYLLDDAIAFVRDAIAIEDVYDSKTIAEAARGSCSPSEVFGASELAAWAEDNGFTKAE